MMMSRPRQTHENPLKRDCKVQSPGLEEAGSPETAFALSNNCYLGNELYAVIYYLMIS